MFEVKQFSDVLPLVYLLLGYCIGFLLLFYILFLPVLVALAVILHAFGGPGSSSTGQLDECLGKLLGQGRSAWRGALV